MQNVKLIEPAKCKMHNVVIIVESSICKTLLSSWLVFGLGTETNFDPSVSNRLLSSAVKWTAIFSWLGDPVVSKISAQVAAEFKMTVSSVFTA